MHPRYVALFEQLVQADALDGHAPCGIYRLADQIDHFVLVGQAIGNELTRAVFSYPLMVSRTRLYAEPLPAKTKIQERRVGHSKPVICARFNIEAFDSLCCHPMEELTNMNQS